MITLYIKTHRITGLKYFGKTEKDDPISYWGSGIRWRRHLMKHGYDCDTEIYLQSEDRNYIIREALRFSRAYDIVNSDLWANLREENGVDGQVKGIVFSDEWCEKISKANKGRKRPDVIKRQKGNSLSEEHRNKIGNGNKGRSVSLETREKIRKGNTGKVLPQEQRDKISKASKNIIRNKEWNESIANSLAKKWIVIDPIGNEYIVVNLTKFCKENGLHAGVMCMVSKGVYKKHKGYTVKRIENEN